MEQFNSEKLKKAIDEFYDVKTKSDKVWARKCFSFIAYNFSDLGIEEISKEYNAKEALILKDIQDFTKIYLNHRECISDINQITEKAL